MLAVTGVMHEADDAYSIRSTWSCYWLDQFLTLALNILILSTFYISMDLSTHYFAHFSGCRASFACSCHYPRMLCHVFWSQVEYKIVCFISEGKLKSVGMLADILGKNRLRRLGFNIAVGHITARQAVMLNKAAEELPSESDITKADDIELQEIVEKASGIISEIKDVQTDTKDLFEHLLRERLGLDKQLRTIRCSLKVEVAKMVELGEHITKERQKLEEFREYPGEYDDAMKEEITKRIDALNDELVTRQESIDLLKGRLNNQIMSFKETIAKVLDIDTSLGEKIRTLFREQGITIASMLTAIGMAIGVLVEALLPGGATTASGEGVEPHP